MEIPVQPMICGAKCEWRGFYPSHPCKKPSRQTSPPFYTEIETGIVDNYVDKCSILWITLGNLPLEIAMRILPA